MNQRDFHSRLAIQSWCFREFREHDQVIHCLKRCGLNNIELCGVHVNPVKDAEFQKTIQYYMDQGIRISAFGVYAFDADEAKARKVFALAETAGFATISADFLEGGLDVAEKLCAEYGKKAAVHNHGRKHALGSIAALDDLFARSSENIGLCLDTAWMLDSGEDPVAAARHFQDRLYGLHIKDFVFDRAGRPEDVIAGTGNLDLDALTDFLVTIRFDGYITLEYEGDVHDPVPATQACVEAVTKSFQRACNR